MIKKKMKLCKCGCRRKYDANEDTVIKCPHCKHIGTSDDFDTVGLDDPDDLWCLICDRHIREKDRGAG